MEKGEALTGDETLARLRGVRPSLPPAEVRIADIVLSNPRRVASLTISQLAGEAHTSETSVLRFARRVGLAGYPELRLALVEVAAAERPTTRRPGDLSPDDSLDDIVEKVATAGSDAVVDTCRRLDRSALAAAAEALATAGRIELFGVAASALVAEDLDLKLHRIGKASHAWSDSHLGLTSAALLGAGDVQIVVSHSGTTVEAVEILTTARGRGAVTVAITNAATSPVAKAADHVLLTAADETWMRSSATASRIAALVVVDILFLATAHADIDAAVRAVAGTRDAVQGHHRSR